MRCHCGLINTVTRMMSVDGEVDEIAAEAPKRREDVFLVSAGKPAVSDDVGDQDRRELADLARTNYNPRYARNKRIQASAYFSWPLAAKWWPS